MEPEGSLPHSQEPAICPYPELKYTYHKIKSHYFIRWYRGSVLAFSTEVRGFKPGRSRRIFRAKKSSARLPPEGK